MKYFFLLLFFSTQLSAQYLDVDSARQLIRSEKNNKEKFFGYFSLDRYYYTSGLFDSSALLQKQLYIMAVELKNDSLIADVYRAMGNRYLTETDYNFALIFYFKGLDYATSSNTRAMLDAQIAYPYSLTENNELALKYLKKSDSIGMFPKQLFFKNIFYGAVWNNLQQPDSALVHLQKADQPEIKYPDGTLNSILLAQTAYAYELKGDADHAAVYYRKALAFCKEQNLAWGSVRHGNLYCNFLLKQQNFPEAKHIALEILGIAQKHHINEGISSVSDILRKVYTHENEKDSALLYSAMQIEYKDSVSSQKRISEFQNITFAEQLKEIDEQAKAAREKEQRHQNIQYALIALGIIIFVTLFLLLSRTLIVNEKLISFLIVLGLLVVFEFINLVIHPWLACFTNESPVLMLAALVIIASLLIPLHHRLEHWIKEKIIEKNKVIRLAAAKKTIEVLEKESKDV
ncbi:MAG: hypothetical protein QM764_04560 [Chitinophagaceae bacterium]